MTQSIQGEHLQDVFSKIFNDRLAPKLAGLRGDKTGARHRLIRDIKILAVLVVALNIAGIVLSDEPFYVWLIPTAIIVASACVFLFPRHYKSWNRSLTQAIMPEVCQVMENITYDRDGAPKDFFRPFVDIGMFNHVNGAGLQHYITGHYRDIRFALANANLTDSSGSGKQTVFYGVLFQIECPIHIPLPILIQFGTPRLAKDFSRALSSGKHVPKTQVTMGRSDFEERFTVYCDDEQVARNVVTDAVMDALLRIYEQDTGDSRHRYVVAGFHETTFYMALHRCETVVGWGPLRYEAPVGLLEAGPLLATDESVAKRVRRLLGDIGLVYRIIDRLRGQ